MTDREKAVRRIGEGLDLPPEVIDEVASGGWIAGPPETIYDPVPGTPWPIAEIPDDELPTLPGAAYFVPPGSIFDFPRIRALRGGPEPLEFPAPPTLNAADMIEAQAADLQAEFPYRTLLACRELAARLVDEVLTWDAMWPEAEGDCACPEAGRELEAWHREGCPQWGLPL